jgi:DNA/RNA endonuclease YhcR with UshA esterase domain
MVKWFFYLLFFFFLITPLDAHPPPPLVNAEQIVTVKGKILSIQKYHLINQPAPFVQFLLRSDSEEITVDVGPDWYVSNQGFMLIPGEEIEVTGSLFLYKNKKIILANKLQQRRDILNLRDKKGKNLWND